MFKFNIAFFRETRSEAYDTKIEIDENEICHFYEQKIDKFGTGISGTVMANHLRKYDSDI